LLKFLLVLTVMVVVYSILFHFIMAAEGKDHTWLTGGYRPAIPLTVNALCPAVRAGPPARPTVHRAATVSAGLP
jgi:uncharacterized protein (UPF0333 family)